MDVSAGSGEVSGELVCICTDAALCTGITRDTGAKFGHTGICGAAIITSSDRVGSGEGTVVWDDTSTACESSVVGLARNGSRCVLTGIFGERTTTTIAGMGAHAGRGAVTGESACTSTAIAHIGEIIRVIGVVFVHTGICGDVTTTTKPTGGSGDDPVASVVICTACVS